MIERTVHGDVTSYRLSWWRSRMVGLAVHVYVVRGTMIDTGFPAAAKDVTSVLDTEHIRGVIVTHQHEDHAGNVAWIAERGIPLNMSAATEAAVRAVHPIGLYRHITWRAMPAFTGVVTPPHATDLRLLHTPGHSPDHHVVWDDETGSVYAGDLFLGVRVKIAHAYEDVDAMIASLRAVATMQPARVFCAHRGLLPSGSRLLQAKADWLEETTFTVNALSSQGRSIGQIRRAVFGNRGLTHWFSAGDYSPDHLVQSMLRSTRYRAGRDDPPDPTAGGPSATPSWPLGPDGHR